VSDDLEVSSDFAKVKFNQRIHQAVLKEKNHNKTMFLSERRLFNLVFKQFGFRHARHASVMCSKV